MRLPTEPTPRVLDPYAQSVLLYGAPGVGKSTFCANLKDAVFLDTEQGLKHLHTYQVPVTSWPELDEAIRALLSGDHTFRVVIIDTLDEIVSLAIRHVCAKLNIEDMTDRGGGIRAWGLVNRRLNDALKLLAAGPFGVVWLSHEKTVSVATDGHIIRADERYKGPVVQRVMPSVSGKAGQIVTSLCDVVMRATIQGERRVVETQPSESRIAKDRTGILPAVFELNPEVYLEFFRAEYKRRQSKPGAEKSAAPQLVGGAA